MTETKAFDVSKLKPGDEVGIERNHDGTWEPWAVSRVVAVDDEMIELKDYDFYLRDGRCASNYFSRRRLAAPTDEGRRFVMQETVSTELGILKSETRSMDLPTLRRLKAWIDARGWEAACES